LDQELLAYEQQTSPADEIVFFVAESTLSRTRSSYIFKKHKPRFVLAPNGGMELVAVPPGAGTLTDVLYRLLSHFYLPYFLELQLDAWQRATPPGGESEPSAPPPRIPLGELEQRILSRAQQVAAERGQRMTVLADLPEETREELRRFAAERNVAVLEVDIDRRQDDVVFGPLDRHWNVQAQHLIAAQLWEQIQARIVRSDRGDKPPADTAYDPAPRVDA
jgi:hypothetical protein